MQFSDSSFEENFFGAVTVGERGQVVIPVEARKRFDIQPGDKLLVVGCHPGNHGVVLLKIDALRDFMETMLRNLSRFQAELDDRE